MTPSYNCENCGRKRFVGDPHRCPAAPAPTPQPVCGIRDWFSPRVCDKPRGHDGCHEDSKIPSPAPTEPVTPEPCNCDKFYLEGNDHMPGCPKSSEPVIAPEQPVTPTEAEREQARHLCWCELCNMDTDCSRRDSIARALARTRAEAMEEAAQEITSLIELQDVLRDASRGTERASRNGIVIGLKMARETLAAIRAKGGR